MHKLICEVDGGYEEVIVYNVNDFPYHKYSNLQQKEGFLPLICMFDIETTTLTDTIAFMYHWQCCIEDDVVFGRTWEEYREWIEKIHSHFCLEDNRKLVFYVHNLSFEFQYIRNFFEWDSVFAKDVRKVLKAESSNIEYRCSYYLTNMSFDKACKNAKKCIFKKLSGDKFNYNKIRYPWTPVDQFEESYMYCDVRGGVEFLRDFFEDDTLRTIPLTSTGFVRRDCRNAMRKNFVNRKNFKKQAINRDVFQMLENVKRGGNTHANRAFVEQTVSNVFNFDIRSAYPYVMLTKYYPSSAFRKVKIDSREKFEQCLKKYCCMFTIVIEDLELNLDAPCPYIPFHKLHKWDKESTIVFNGRVLASKMIIMSMLEIDWEIINSMYTYKRIAIHIMYVANRGMLSKELRNTILDYFYKKTALKEVDDYLYVKSKNKLNGIFGMTYSNPVHDNIKLIDSVWKKEKGDINEELDRYYKSKNSFLNPTHGAWVTAHCRYLLQQIINITGEWTLYNDTDSDKALKVDFVKIDELNRQIEEECEQKGAYIDFNGKRFYLGILEQEDSYKKFRTMGAKKYAYTTFKTKKTEEDELHITIAGVAKSKGAKELKDIENMKTGFCFREAGGNELKYFDYKEPFYININGRKVLTGSSIGIYKSTYTLGLTKEFIENKEKYLTKHMESCYN